MFLLTSLFMLAAPIIVDPNSIANLTQLEDKSFHISAQFITTANVDLIYDTLTDYEHHPQFIHTIKKVVEIKSIQQNTNVITKIINEEITAHVLIFSETVHVTLQVNEILDQHRIEFEDIGHKDFIIYKGYWQITPHDNVNVVTHEVTLLPTFKAPTWIVRRLFRKDSMKLLIEIQEEIIRRAKL
jgi:ribosome-associated toxin RatA of RatAB toxin-antitoxin module